MNEEQDTIKNQSADSEPARQSVENQKLNQLSPLDDLLKKSFVAYKSIFWKVTGMMLVPMLFALSFVVLLVAYTTSAFLLDGAVANIANIIFGFLGFAIIILVLVVSYISRAGVFVLVRDFQKQLSIKEAFFSAKKLTWNFVIVNMSVALFTFLWSLLFLIPGLVMMIFYSMSLWAYFSEGFTGTKALERSKELVGGYFWPIVARYGAVILIFIAIFYLPTIFIESIILNIVWNFIGSIVSFLLAPFVVIFTYSIFLELKKIKGESQIEKKGGSKAIIIVFVSIIIMFIVLFAVVVTNMSIAMNLIHLGDLNDARQRAMDTQRVSDVKQTSILLALAAAEHPKAVLMCSSNFDQEKECVTGDSVSHVVGVRDLNDSKLDIDYSLKQDFSRFIDPEMSTAIDIDSHTCSPDSRVACQYSLQINNDLNNIDTIKILFYTEDNISTLSGGKVHSIDSNGVMID